MNYADKFKDPRWQKKRLEVLNRAAWKCEACGRSDEELHVHHLFYPKGDPWEIALMYLECLCAVCHSAREDYNSMSIWMIRTRPTREIVTEEYRKNFLQMVAEGSS